MEHHEIVIIGGGPAGLAMALELNTLGLKDVVVLEREQQAGGIPRHCGHLGFGIDNKNRFLTGPKFAAKLRELTKGLDIRTGTTVLEFTLRGTLRLHSTSGISEMSATRIILATGTRESSRAARLIGGNRLPGVMNTGTFQQLVYLKQQKPFSNPVIIGSEWVSFSNLLTCRHAKIRPIWMITENAKPDAPSYFGLGARLAFGVPMKRNSKLISINGNTKVESVEVITNGSKETIACDGVIISGKFKSELSLLPSGSVIPAQAGIQLSIIGNANGKLNTAGRCMIEARATAAEIASDLK
jgi:NADPH-dependent 2,4-dienoyl-CoA reductase/sulfur reductase-like enzyme